MDPAAARPGLLVRQPMDADEAGWRGLWQAYVAFYRAAVPPAVTDHTWRRILDPASPVFGRMAELGGRVVGFAVGVLHEATWTSAPVCYLEDLFVDPSARRLGVGRRLVEDMLRLAAEQGWSRLYWHTEAGNFPARRLYDSFVLADEFVRYRLVLRQG